jgi:YidC/Oxa1 family membrane protein insertase
VLVTINDFLAGLGLGNEWTWGLAIIGLTIIVRLILFPLTWKQYKSAQQMQMIQPQIKQLQKKYKGDRGKLQEETMKLYSEHRVNPFASCLPLLLQLPVFIALYAAIAGKGPLSAPEYQESVKLLFNAPFLWIPKLGLPDPTYILLILYVATQMISTELMVATQSDSTQKWIMRAMPIMFVLFLFRFPAGLFVYWVTTNVWTIGQQLVIRRTMPKPEDLAAKAKSKPKKRSRFMETLMASQSEAVKQREEKMAKKGGAGSGGAKQGSVAAGAKKTTPGAKKPPPGKGKGKPAQPQGAKPARPQGAKPKGVAGGQSAKSKSSGQAAGGSPAVPAGDEGANTSADGPTADD